MGSGFESQRGERVVGEGGATRAQKSRGKCFYCQKEGHWKRDCYKGKADEGKNTRSGTARSGTRLAFTAIGNEWSETVMGAWIVDSGESQYLLALERYSWKKPMKLSYQRGFSLLIVLRFKQWDDGTSKLESCTYPMCYFFLS